MTNEKVIIKNLNEWMSNNCFICNRLDCYTRNLLKSTNIITKRRIEFMGHNNGILLNKCRNFKYGFRDRSKEYNDKFLLNMF